MRIASPEGHTRTCREKQAQNKQVRQAKLLRKGNTNIVRH